MESRSTAEILEMVDWLYDLQHTGVKLGLDNIRGLLRVLDHPERCYRSAIVGGTNGKGSVAAMLHALLGAHGVGAGMFTSPHLVRPNERIRCRDDDIDDGALAGALATLRQEIATALDDGRLEVHPSFFEVIAATALHVFRERHLDAAVLEVGLGGRLDATNAVDADLSVIVGVDLDHTKTLGPTLERIAFEKAGIVKAGRPLVSGVVQQAALDVLRRTCDERGAELIDARLMVRFTDEKPDGRLTFETPHARYEDLVLSLAGRHQIDNARVALAAFETLAPRLGVQPDTDSVRRALAGVRWMGRLQWMRVDHLAVDLLLDGAHNPAGSRALAAYLDADSRPAPVALLGAMHDKLLPQMLETLSERIESLVVTRPGVRRAADPEEVAEIARRAGMRSVEVVERPDRALERAVELAGQRRFVLVTGSLYLIGEILGVLEQRDVPGPVSM